MKKGLIIGIAVGILSTLLFLHAYSIYSIGKLARSNQANIISIVDFLNKAQKNDNQ